MPENPSEPPHCSPIFNAPAGTVSRRTSFSAGSISRMRALIASMVLRVPPVS